MQKIQTNQANMIARECMVTALMKLLKKKKISNISITELCQCAGVSRMTYYRNYSSKEEILTSHLKKIMEEYRLDFELQHISSDFWSIQNMLHCMNYFEIHHAFLESLFQSNLSKYFISALTDYILSVWYSEGDSVERFFRLQAFSGSLYNTYLAWHANPNLATKEQLARYLHNIYAPNA